jgi:hypothetical protein
MMCVQLPLDSQVWRRWQFAELSTTEAIAARASCLLCRGLFSFGPVVFVHGSGAFPVNRAKDFRKPYSLHMLALALTMFTQIENDCIPTLRDESLQ